MRYKPVPYTGRICMVLFEDEGRDFGFVLEDQGEIVRVQSDDGDIYTVAKNQVIIA